MNDPRTITAVTKDGKKRRFPVDKACRIVAFGVALSYGNVPKNYPILGAFLNVLYCKGEWHKLLFTKPVYSESQLYKSVTDATNLDREFCLMAMAERYNVTKNDLLRVEALLQTVSTLPTYVEDPVFDKLVVVDYE